MVLGQLRSIGMMPTVTIATPPSAIARRYSTYASVTNPSLQRYLAIAGTITLFFRIMLPTLTGFRKL